VAQWIVTLFVSAFLVHLAFVAVTLAAARPFNLRVLAVQVGAIPVFKHGRFTLGLLPLTGFVRFADTREDAVAEDDPSAFDNQPRLVRIALMLAGPAGILLLAMALRGSAGWPSFFHAFHQLIGGAIDPMGRGASMASDFLQFAAREGALATGGVFAAKVAAFNLLPLPTLNGGLALIELVRPRRSAAFDRIVERLWHVSIWLMLAFVGSWLFAFYVAHGR